MEPLKSIVAAETHLSLFGDNTIDFKGNQYVPDETRGYFLFKLSHAFPVATAYGTGLLPEVISISHSSLRHQNLNKEHQIALYHPDKPGMSDSVIGCILDVDFPAQPATGWSLASADGLAETPAITGVASFFKQTQGMIRLLGAHLAGRHRYTVSMEVRYPYEEAGFAVNRRGNGQLSQFRDSTPEMLDKAGYDYCPAKDAPDELVATFSKKKNRIVGPYRNRPAALLMGGLNNPVHYAGVGLVKFGAEAPAEIIQMAASSPGFSSEPFQALAGLLGQALSKQAA